MVVGEVINESPTSKRLLVTLNATLPSFFTMIVAYLEAKDELEIRLPTIVKPPL